MADQAWTPPESDAVWTPPADDALPAPTPEEQYREYWKYNPAVDTTNIPKDKLDDFMANPPPRRVPASEQLSSLTGIPKVLAEANPITPRIAFGAGRLGAFTGSVGAAFDSALGRPDAASADLEEGRRRAQDWSDNVYKFAGYMPGKLATDKGNEMADRMLAAPGKVIDAVGGAAGPVADILTSNADIAYDDQGNPIAGPGGVTHSLNPYEIENISDTAKGVLGGAAAVGGVPTVKGATRQIGRATEGARTALLDRGLAKPTQADIDAGYVPKPKKEKTSEAAATPAAPDLGEPVTADTLRAQPNPIPPPEGTAAHEAQRPAAAAAATPPEQPQEPSAQPQDTSLGSTSAGGAMRGSVPLFPKDEGEGGRVPLFAPPTKEGPEENPALDPQAQAERVAHLDALDKLSGGRLPTRRNSAITGDYNATGDDFQTREVEPANGPMKAQIASENKALHAATENIHEATGSQFDNSVDPQTVSNRGRVIRNAVNAIEKHFDDATDGLYKTARAQNQGRPIPKLKRVSDYLNDDSNFTNDAEIGLQKAAKLRMERLWTTGDPDKGAPPGSVNAAERLREFLNEKGKNPGAMGVARDLKNHLDMDVAEHGGPGLFEAARNMRLHNYQMLEEPTGIKKLLAPSDSQGINHAIPTEKVADYVADLPKEQHDHVLNVLRAGAHLSPEIAEKSAAAIRELQAHVISRIHDAATNKSDGTWNARTFYNAAAGYGPKLPTLFRDNPKVVEGLKTVSRAGNVLKMDKHYPGAGAQVARTGLAGRAVEAAGAFASAAAHELPLGRILGRGIEAGTDKLTGKMGENAHAADVAKRLVDRYGRSRGSFQLFNDNDLNQGRDRDTFHGKSVERNPRKEYNANSQLAGGRQRLTPEQQSIIDRLGGGRPLGERVGGGKMRGSVRVMDDEEAPRSEEEGAQLNIGLHQGKEGDKDFRKMSKQEAQAAVESVGAKVTKNTVLTPKQHGVYEPTAVLSTDRPLTPNEMQQVLAKTKQSAIPQRTGQGDEEMHVAPGHEEIAKEEGWDKFNRDYFREHDGRTASETEAAKGEDHPDWIPQRLITSKKAEAADPADRPKVDLKTFKSTPSMFEKNMDAVRDYSNVTEAQSKKPAAELAKDFIKHVKDNLLALHDKVPEATRNRSKQWYDGANKIAKDFAAKHGITDSQGAGVLAALSPQKDWYQNVSLAQRVLDINKGKGEEFYNNHKFDDKMEEALTSRPALNKPEYKGIVDLLRGRSLGDIEKHAELTPEAKTTAKALWTRLYDEAYNERGHRLVTPEGEFGDYVKKKDGTNTGTGWGSLGEIAKAIKVIESDGSAKSISPLMGDMHKVRNFYNNILSPNSRHGDVTMDTHAVAAGLMKPLSGSSTEVAHNFGSSPGKGMKGAGGSAITGIQGTYPLYAEAYRQAAKERGILPREMQSITWEAIRGLFPDTFKTAANASAIDAIWKDYRAGKITQKQARNKIYEKAGGIRPPTWEGSSGSDEGGEGAADAR